MRSRLKVWQRMCRYHSSITIYPEAHTLNRIILDLVSQHLANPSSIYFVRLPNALRHLQDLCTANWRTVALEFWTFSSPMTRPKIVTNVSLIIHNKTPADRSAFAHLPHLWKASNLRALLTLTLSVSWINRPLFVLFINRFRKRSRIASEAVPYQFLHFTQC